jgi:TolB protein
MRRLCRIIVCLFTCILLSTNAQAKIYVLIDEASSRKFPIAVPEFTNIKGAKTSLSREITRLFKNNLDIAGLFKVLDESSFIGQGSPGSRVDFARWTAIEAYGLVKGIVDSKGGGRILIEMRLYDTRSQQLLVGKQYVVGKKDYHIAVHRFVDDFMKSLTGKQGPFSSKVVAACGKTGKRQIYSFYIDGTGMKRVTRLKANNISPNWSPDGHQIAFTSFLSYYPEIYLINADGKGLKQITSNKATNITPAFSPTGRSIVFSSSRSGDVDLFLMSRSGRIGARVTNVLNIDVSPSWSPDGSQLVFASERAGNLHLFVQGVGGGGATRLTYTGYQNDQPDWSPDGKKIIFTSRDRGAFDVFIMNSDGSTIQRLTRGEGNNESPTWSPDSRYIAFSSSRAGGSGVYVMLDDGSNQTLIPRTGGCINPDWGPRLK